MKTASCRFLVVLGALALMGCTRVDPGHVGIKINYSGTYRGAQDVPVVQGWAFFTPFVSTIFEYPTFVQTAQWTRADTKESPGNEEVSFNSYDGMVFTVDINLSYTLDPAKVPAFWVKFRSDNLWSFTHGYLRSVARDAFNAVGSRFTAEQIYGEKKEEVLAAAHKRINEDVADVGVRIEQFGYLGAIRAPEAIVNAINGKIKATQDAQRTENELRSAKAEAQKTIATAEGAARAKVVQAEGEAKANALLAQSITPMLLEWRRLELTGHAVEKWNGQRPTVEGGTGGLLLQLSPSGGVK